MSMCQVLLSIKPQYVNSILSGEKKYEFRKVRCRQEVDKIVIYATSPIKMVLAEAEIEEIIEDSILNVWNKTKEFSGISYKFFRSYFKGRDSAIAYKLKNVVRYENPRTLLDYGVSSAPQSFVYIKELKQKW